MILICCFLTFTHSVPELLYSKMKLMFTPQHVFRHNPDMRHILLTGLGLLDVYLAQSILLCDQCQCESIWKAKRWICKQDLQWKRLKLPAVVCTTPDSLVKIKIQTLICLYFFFFELKNGQSFDVTDEALLLNGGVGHFR